MNRKAFYHLLKRYLEDDCTEEEKKLVEQWYELLGDDDERELMPGEEIKATIQRLWPSIQEQTVLQEDMAAVTMTARERGARTISLWTRWIGAAVIVSAIAMGVYLWSVTPKDRAVFKNDRQLAGYNMTRNDTTIEDTVYLRDGSMVILEPQARLYYPDSFNSKREVYLEGNAFFEVKKNPRQPFFVYSSNIVTQVLGTSFFVRSDNNTNSVEVSVRTGKVTVYEYGRENAPSKDNEEANGVILKPNQKVVYNSTDHHFRTTLIEVPLPVVSNNKTEDKITELNFVFEEKPISEVLSLLEKAYHIEMVMENESLANCLFSGDIKGQDLYGQLEIICQSIQANYEIRGTRILIKGAGCE